MLERYVHGVLFNSSCLAFAPSELLTETTTQLLRSLAIDLFMKKPIESVKKLALDKIYLVGANGKA